MATQDEQGNQGNTTQSTQAAGNADGGNGAGATQALTWETWLEGQDEQVRTLIQKQTEGLLNTVKATRSERDDLAKQIKDLAKKQAEGSDARRALDEMSAKLETTERRAAFMEEAIKPEVQCKNPRAAFLLAEAENLFTKRGDPDWAAIKAAAPELFGTVSANANAGTGTQKPPTPAQNMNDFIRKASGRK